MSQERNILVKLQLCEPGSSPVCKRVMASDYATLMVMAAKLAARCNQQPEGLRYNDGHDWILIEDDMDLEFAYDFATSECKKQTQSIVPASALGEASQIIFNIKMKGAVAPVIEQKEEIKEIAAMPATDSKQKSKGVPQKAVKNMIKAEFEKQAKECFAKLLKSEELPAPDMTIWDAHAVHMGVACDNCQVFPIRGLRYKCSVCKNFDFCAQCEDRCEHEHAFLKISQPGGAPDVMVTVLGEEQPEEEESKSEVSSRSYEIVRQMMSQFKGNDDCGGKDGMPWKHMMKQFMGNFTSDANGKFNAEKFGKKMAAVGAKQQNKQKGSQGKKGWKQARAILKRKPEEVLELAPDQTSMVQIEVFNDTYWPWKSDCMITFADEQPENCEMPLDIFQVSIAQGLKGKTSATFEIPITMGGHVLADQDKVHQMNLTFRGPRGAQFGEPIPIKFKCVLPKRQASEEADAIKAEQ